MDRLVRIDIDELSQVTDDELPNGLLLQWFDGSGYVLRVKDNEYHGATLVELWENYHTE